MFGSAGGNVTVTETTSTGCVGSSVSLAVAVGPNHAPVAQDKAMSTAKDTAAALAKAKLMLGATDPDHDHLSVSAAGPGSQRGGTVTLETDDVKDTPPTGFTGSDSFSFTLSDGNGGTANGTVTVAVAANGGESPNIISPPTYDSRSGTFRVTFAGIPDYVYTIETATDSGSPWSFLKTATAGPDGLFEVTDTPSPPASSRYYRTVCP